ncbi:MAG TPA: diguanylate cyclase [Longimicrobium sp.]|nr:diguanylate cyclase [Longimicrobium sp.]
MRADSEPIRLHLIYPGSLPQPRTIHLRREVSPRAPRIALPAAVLLTAAVGALDWAVGLEVSVLALYLLPPALAGWHAGRQWAIALAVLGAVVWLGADLLSGHPYSHLAIPYWNALARFAIFAAFGILAAELRTARERAARGPDEDGLPAAGSFYRMLEQEYARVLRYGRPVTLAYVDAGGVRGDPGPGGEAFAAAVLDALRSTLRGTDVVARPRGKEFALLLTDTGHDAAAVALGRLRGVLAGLAQRQGGGASIIVGAVSCAHPASDVNQLIQRAYQLMYQGERVPGHVVLAHEPLADPVLPETGTAF